MQVEASRFTELGYVGRDVDDIVKDLAEAAMTHVRGRARGALAAAAAVRAEATILAALLGPLPAVETLESMRALYRQGSAPAPCTPHAARSAHASCMHASETRSGWLTALWLRPCSVCRT